METIRIEGPCDWWDQFVWDSPGGTIFSTLRFLSYHPPGRFPLVNLAVKDEGRPLAVIAGGEVVRDGRRFYRSPLGASFGGPLFGAAADLRTTVEAVDSMTAGLAALGYAGVELVGAPACYLAGDDQGLKFALGRAGYRLVSQDATLVVDLAGWEEDGLDPVLARNVRRAERGGVRVAAGDDLAGFYDVLVANLAAKGAKPTHSLEELERLAGLFPDRVILMAASLDGAMIGGCLVFICNARAALAFYICDDRSRAQLRVAEAALHGAAGLLKRMGLRCFDLGTVSMGDDVNWGLVRFKSKFRPATYVREHYLRVLEGEAC